MNRRATFGLLAVFFISGVCALLYEIVWGRQLAFVFGSSMRAITTVLACFMGGLALGSFLGGRLSQRVRNPARLYGWIELAIGSICLLTPLLMELALPLYRKLYAVSGDSPALLTLARLLVSSAILIPPTLLMGATLPLLTAAFAPDRASLGRAAGHLYGLNTLGALVGCVAAGFFLLPLIGLKATTLLAAGLNVLSGLLALRLARPIPSAAALAVPLRAASPLAPPAQDLLRLRSPDLLLAYGLCGFASMAAQIAWTRALIMIMGASTYAFSTVTACFIAGSGLGCLIMTRFLPRVREPLPWAAGLAAVGALAGLVAIPLFSLLPDLITRLSREATPSFNRILATEAFAVLGILAVPTFCMGALLPIVCSLAASLAPPHTPTTADPAADRPETGRLIGGLYAANTVGCILGTVMAGFVFIPWVRMGMQRTLVLTAALNALVAARFLLAIPPRLAGSAGPSPFHFPFHSSSRRRLALLAVAGLALAAVAILTPSWASRKFAAAPFLGRGIDPTEYIIDYREGTDATVTVSENRRGDKVLRINGKPDASTRTADMYTQTLLGVIPVGLRPQARSVCIIGFGSGVTAASVLAAAPSASADVAELSEAVLAAAPWFADANDDVLRNPRLTLHRADGRNLLLLGPRQYDIVISEPSNPWLSGVANLFSREFLELSKSRLGGSGLHAQWIHSYSMHPTDFAAVLKTMASVFPHIQLWSLWFGDYLILGSEAPLRLDLDSWTALFDRPPSAARLRRISINHPLQFAQHYVAGGSDLAPLLPDSRTLVDDRPHLEFSAPRYLLNNWGMEIGGALDSLSSANPPFVPGEDPRLIAEFIARIRSAQTARKHLRDSVEAARLGDSRRYLEACLSAASETPEDGRIFLLVLPELHRHLEKAKPESRATLQRYIKRIAELAPGTPSPVATP